MYEHYAEEDIFNEEDLFHHEYRFDPEAWSIPKAIPIEPATINFHTRPSVNTASIDPIERRWIDDVVSAYNDTAGHWVYNATATAESRPLFQGWTINPPICDADGIRVMIPLSQEEKEDDLVEDVDLSMFI